MFCKYCGKDAPSDSRFCAFCGKELNSTMENDLSEAFSGRTMTASWIALFISAVCCFMRMCSTFDDGLEAQLSGLFGGSIIVSDDDVDFLTGAAVSFIKYLPQFIMLVLLALFLLLLNASAGKKQRNFGRKNFTLLKVYSVIALSLYTVYALFILVGSASGLLICCTVEELVLVLFVMLVMLGIATLVFLFFLKASQYVSFVGKSFGMDSMKRMPVLCTVFLIVMSVFNFIMNVIFLMKGIFAMLPAGLVNAGTDGQSAFSNFCAFGEYLALMIFTVCMAFMSIKIKKVVRENLENRRIDRTFD